MHVFTSRTRSLSLGPGRRPGQGDVEELVKESFFCTRGVAGMYPKKRLPDGESKQEVFPLKCSGPLGMADAVLGGTHLSLVWRERLSVGAPKRMVLCSWTNLLQRVKNDRRLCLNI